MSYKRIRDSELPDIYEYGDYLTSDDLNQIVTVFKDGINYNKNEINRIITGKENSNIAYDLETLYAFSGSEGSFAYLINPIELGDGIKLYRYTSGAWIYQTNLSLIDVYDLILNKQKNELQVSPDIPTEDSVIMWYKVLDVGVTPPIVYDTISGGLFTDSISDILSGGEFNQVLTDTVQGGTF